jgi:hypothetical protein
MSGLVVRIRNFDENGLTHRKSIPYRMGHDKEIGIGDMEYVGVSG